MPFTFVFREEAASAERRATFDKDEVTFGRWPALEVVLVSGLVGLRHARLLFRDQQVIISDLGCVNGTWLNGGRVKRATIVRAGDAITIGDVVLVVEVSNGTTGPLLHVRGREQIEVAARAHMNGDRLATLILTPRRSPTAE